MYLFNSSMTLTPFGRGWLRNLLSAIGQHQPLELQLGTHDWGNKLYQKVQAPVRNMVINQGSVLLPRATERYTEAGLVTVSGQTLAVTSLDVEQLNDVGICEQLRCAVLIQPAGFASRSAQDAPAFVNSIKPPVVVVPNTEWSAGGCRRINGTVICDDSATPPPPPEPEPEQPEPEQPNVADTIPFYVGFGTREARHTRAGWRLPRQQLYIGVNPGIVLHILKTTRLYHG